MSIILNFYASLFNIGMYVCDVSKLSPVKVSRFIIIKKQGYK